MANHQHPQSFHHSRRPPQQPPQLQPQAQIQPQPQPQIQPQHFDPNLLLLQNLGLYSHSQPQNPYFQNPNLTPQNPNFNNHFPIPNNPIQFPQNQSTFPNHMSFQHNHPNSSSPAYSHLYNGDSNNHNSNTNPNPANCPPKQRQTDSITIRPQAPKFPVKRKNDSIVGDRKETLEKIETAVASARCQIIEAGEHVSVWKLSQSALVKLQAESWDSLGFQLHDVPSLHQLIFIEAKINAFIRCHVAVQKITSLFDLREALCKNEGVEKFEELELGPFLQHPLVKHYFSLTQDVEEVYKITSEEIVSHLSLFLYKKRNNVMVEEFVDFVAKKCKVTNPAILGLRVHSLGMHIGFLFKARNAQDFVMKKCMEAAKDSCDKPKKERPLFSLQKKDLDDRFSAITERVTTFASVNKAFCGKHIRFVSSDEDGCISDSSDGEEVGNDSVMSNQCQSSVKRKNGDRVSSCPYPSVAEEMTRLGLKGETEEHSSSYAKSLKSNQRCVPKKKRKLKSQSHGKAIEQTSLLGVGSAETEEEKSPNNADANDSIRMFITTWKDACLGYSAAKVLDKMLEFYKMSRRQRKNIREAFSADPLMGLLNVAVTSIRKGMWDSMYDTFQVMGEAGEANTQANELTEYESIDIAPVEKDSDCLKWGASKPASCVKLENVVRKASEYLAECTVWSGGSSLVDRVLMIARELSRCESRLAEQFSVSEFKLLGHGDFFSFLERNSSLLPKELLNFVRGEVHENQLLEVSIIQQQLVMILSQAVSNLWDEGVVTKEKISELLVRQFPFVSFKIIENGSIQELLDLVGKRRGKDASNCVIFSATLSGSSDYVDSSVNDMRDNSGSIADMEQIDGNLGSVTSRDAINILLKVPFLSDINSWLHWDLVYAPSLGPLLEWLLTEVNVKDFLCLLTRSGRIIRIDHLASGDLFFQSLLQESPFQVAVQLVSLFALSGGRRHVPLSLLKCQARQGFEVIMGNFMQNMVFDDGRRSEKTLEKKPVGGHSSMDIVKNLNGVNSAVALVSRIVIDCLVLLPSEFRFFAADVLLAGLQPLVKDVASAILVQCKRNEERLMLHEIGFSLGIIDWIHDHHSACPITDSKPLISAEAPSVTSIGSDVKAFDFIHGPNKNPSFSGNKDELCRIDTDESTSLGSSEVKNSENNLSYHLAEQDIKEAALVIGSIRRDEFGLDPNISGMESSLLKKQHARLGRALHCLSQELYSQDSHFLLELVQNADDNVYPANVEPTLSFILHETGMTVLNNERGFTAENIRALCDVGNSTKKGSSIGYIGQKGIGFKSVFRVSDAPEIHSNGFHIKFDISQGQIGFVLPTIIPPCDLEMLKGLIPGDDFQNDMDCWNTCIVLPFKPKLLEGSATSCILSMFSDLHPSLLLFLHRLQCIKLRNMLNDSLVVMRKELLGDGIVKVSHGNEQMIWFVQSNKLRPKVIRPNVDMTEISIALTLNESLTGDYEPFLGQQPVFAFLPLRTYGLKFILQADFILPSSREEVDGDSPWNQWLLSEFPALFVNAEKLFCSLPCFRENPAKAVSAYMSFVPLMGEVHGFFSGLPRMIVAKLRQSNCFLLDGCKDKWVPPCKVLRGWNEQAQMLLPDTLLYEHLGLGLLHRDVNVSDALARALGIEEYGPKILVQFITSLGRVQDGIKMMGLRWLFSWLNELYNLLHSKAPNFRNSELELNLIHSLKKVPFIPLSDGTYGSLGEGTIWFHADCINTGHDVEHGNEAFPSLYATLRVVSPALFSEESTDVALINNCTRMLQMIGVQQMSAHELIRIHILPSMSYDKLTDKSKQLMRECITFIMLHLHFSCVDCHAESEHIFSELQSRALILTNHGYKRPVEVPIHFSKEFGNSVDAKKLISGLEYKWHEVDSMYLKHPTTEPMPRRLVKWREFFQKLGVTDFVKVVPTEKAVADLSPAMLNQMCDKHLLSSGHMLRDWESPELVHILSLLSNDGNQERCKYLLETLDALWDDHFSDKVFGYCISNPGTSDIRFKSSLWHCISDVRWVVSSVDNKLHFPRELFHDCDAVHSILGCHAPYAVPKVKSVKLLSEIGFKTQATLDDVLEMLQTWRTMDSTVTASMSQMSKLYSFIWKEMAICRQQVLDALNSGPFIFIPCAPVKHYEDVVGGVFLSPEDVYWHDSTGAWDNKKEVEFSLDTSSIPLNKTLCSIYPGLHDFFVNECGVHEAPSFCHYIEILQQLSRNSSSLQAANAVFQILLKWSDDLKCGALTSDEVSSLKECLLQSEFGVLPACQDKWVSLHPSFGLVCWSDDDALKKEFKHKDNIEFLYFGELTDDEKEMLHTKVSVLLQNFGIPALSKVVSREAIYYGPADCGFKSTMVAWVLPFAQRYVYNLHTERYNKFKQSGMELHQLRIIVVEKLFYHNVIKRCGITSKKRTECSSLLQGNILYTTRESDSHSVFMELSRLFFDGAPELHLANFLHMITTMAESGSTEEQMEFFILNSQKMVELPVEEPVWSLSFSPSSVESKEGLAGGLLTNINDQISSKSKKKPAHSSWPPVDWKTAPGFRFARENGFTTRPMTTDQSGDADTVDGLFEGSAQEKAEVTLKEINEDVVIEDDEVIGPDSTALPLCENQVELVNNPPQPSEALAEHMNIVVESLCPEEGQSKSSSKDQLSNTPGAQQAIQTGRLGEQVAFRYFVGKAGEAEVKWVNQDKETGLPYDIVLEDGQNREFIEVKASRYAKKDWFVISTREWQFATEKGDSFSIAYVLLSGQKLARIVVYKNPVKLCQLGKLQLTVTIPKSHQEPSQ